MAMYNGALGENTNDNLLFVSEVPALCRAKRLCRLSLKVLCHLFRNQLVNG